MIPKLIHQTAKTAEIPSAWRAYQQKVRALHPDWTYRLWTDADNLAFVKQEFPAFFDTFVALPKNIMRADVIRYLLLYRLGGLYLDLDYEMIKPFDLREHAVVLPWESDGQMGPGNDLVSNSVFAAEPEHVVFKMAIEDLSAKPPLDPTVSVIDATGPRFLTRISNQAVAAGVVVYTPPRVWFNPVTPHNRRQYQAIVGSGASYGIHHCHGSWRQYTLAANLKRHVGKWVKRFT